MLCGRDYGRRAAPSDRTGKEVTGDSGEAMPAENCLVRCGATYTNTIQQSVRIFGQTGKAFYGRMRRKNQDALFWESEEGKERRGIKFGKSLVKSYSNSIWQFCFDLSGSFESGSFAVWRLDDQRQDHWWLRSA